MSKRKKEIFSQLLSRSEAGQKSLAWLIDPEKIHEDQSVIKQLKNYSSSSLDLILVGGSTMDAVDFHQAVQSIQAASGDIPVIIFPGSNTQLSSEADAILFLSLLSGRNPQYLIEEQVKAADRVQEVSLEVISTAYLLVNDGHLGSVHYASGTLPMLNSQPELCARTALAGKFMGMKTTYLDAGSGSQSVVHPRVIRRVKEKVGDLLFVGGGIDSLSKCKAAWEAGADVIVIGNAIEKDPGFLAEVISYRDVKRFSLHVN
ncbi:geranylgeranylglyceryl/heptaprenylglyceryl phosphate synthase [Algoriphagus namhaensis]